jgi:hypothetical protein
MLPLIEAKLIHLYDDRWASYLPDGSTRDMTVIEKRDKNVMPLPRYWVRESDVSIRLQGRWAKGWLLGWRDIARSTDERTTINAAFPLSAVGNNLPLLLTRLPAALVACMSAALSSTVQDFCARLKVGGTHLNYFVTRQLPVPAPAAFQAPTGWAPKRVLSEWIADRVIELAYTSSAMAPLALDLRDDGPPFRWSAERRAQLRAELDAAFFHLYGLGRDEAAYVLDSFPIVKRKDEATLGDYRTKRLVLTAYDEMAEAMRTGGPYVSPLDPPPGNGPRHSNRQAVPA